MNYRDFKPYSKVSSLTLGGGGIGQVWGETTSEKEQLKQSMLP